ncbi:2Fe-2S iron-sulfur cluster-binding protein [Actinophytocola oryzae]|uniref:Sarcosine oxidase subunit alpha n=1 Tax=Actinophytocola oryzae TaxID=502181 RepID=A0A4R7W4E3_9PSEU|nr:2Fe-2S iron-sulfur cluster-binding protein [Actinophytocola oryzae]TDV57382.1 sarcosine oxidase subunit alpha [Actinophytocola oryzae]
MRLPTGGRIDRTVTLRYTLDGVARTGFAGDTVASAMLADGLVTVGPSQYRGRPRGIVTAGVEEPNALVQVDGEPSLTATTVPLAEGLSVSLLSGVGRLEPLGEMVHDKKFVHTDVLVVGAGPAGLAAALAASSGGARVLLVDDQPAPGGSLLSDPVVLPWVSSTVTELAGRAEVRMLAGATAFGYYDSNYVLVAQKRRLWHVRARRVVLATGAHELPLVFADNDLPGVMSASAVRTYVNRYAVLPGRNVVVHTTNDSAYETAFDLASAGARVVVLDARATPPEDLATRAASLDIEVRANQLVERALGNARVIGVSTGDVELECDLLAVSGGWSPVVHLFSQSRGTLRWDDTLAAFVPDRAAQANQVVGAANGVYGPAEARAEGAAAGVTAAAAVGFPGSLPDLPHVAHRDVVPPRPVWRVPLEPDRCFVDLQRDATVADVLRATRAGMRSPEHVKRFTTIGTGSDQGRTSNLPMLGVLAAALDLGSPGDLGTTTFRAPYVPVSFALMAGRNRGALHDPVRTTPIHPWHVAAGAVFEDVGQWRRPRFYPKPGESMEEAVLRECGAARTGVAVQDASTLGKIEVVGADAGEFLNRMYTNAFKKLAVGACRYGMMCGPDGMVMDDGVTMRLAEDRYYVTTTTGGAAKVLDWFEEWAQTEWPTLDVTFTSVTEQWSTIAVVGPESRTVVSRLVSEDVSAGGFPFMTFRNVVLHNEVPARIARISFSGELAYEVNVASWYGLATWEAVLEAGEDLAIVPYGTETMHVLRAEKGFPIVGQDTDGTVTPHDLGMSWIVSTRKDFVGRRSLRRRDTRRPDRKQLVGLLPTDPNLLIPEGTQLIAPNTPLTPPVPMLGHVTSSYRSAALSRTFALALVKGGRSRLGEKVLAPLGDSLAEATITDPVFYDKEGLRRDG